MQGLRFRVAGSKGEDSNPCVDIKQGTRVGVKGLEL